MSGIKREDWLLSLQVDDEVGIKEVTKGMGNSYIFSIDRIKEIKEDSIVVASGVVFNKNGLYRYKVDTYTTISFEYELVPLTDELKEKESIIILRN